MAYTENNLRAVTDYNLDITANWTLTRDENGDPFPITDEATFRTWLESGTDGEGFRSNSFTDITIFNFKKVGDRIRCNLEATGSTFALTVLDVSSFAKAGTQIEFTILPLTGNQIITFDPSIGMTDSLQELDLTGNQIVTFDPSIALPSSLITIRLNGNQIVTFNPSIALPSSLIQIDLASNQIITFDPSIALPSSLEQLIVRDNQIITFDPSIALPSSLEYLALNNNQIATFDPSIALSNSLTQLLLNGNEIITFDPSIALPNSLSVLNLSFNQIVTFNPSIALPITTQTILLNDNQMTTAGYTASETWATGLHNAPIGGIISFANNVNSVSGTNLETILLGKGWAVTA